MKKIKYIIPILIICLGISPHDAFAQENAEKPMSISFNKSTLRTFGASSDQWHMTWHGDGNAYSAWGDGTGWDKNRDCYLGVTRISGTPPSFSGTDLFCQPRPGSADSKPNGIYSVGNALYLFYYNKAGAAGTGGLTVIGAKSTNNGASFDTGKVIAGNGTIHPGVRMSGLVHFGKGHTGLPSSLDSNFIYAFFVHSASQGSPLYFARGKAADPLKAENWEWHTGSGWGTFAQKKPIINMINNLTWYHTIMTYNAPLNKYFLNYFTGTNGTLHVLVADQPWGPFKEIYSGNMGIDNFRKFTVQVMPNTISSDGKTMWYAFSGHPEWDKVGFIQAHLEGDIASPNTQCNLLDSKKPLFQGYAASYNVFSSGKELLLSADCSSSQPKVTIGADNPSVLVYNKGYKTSGTSWTPLTLTCSGQSVSDNNGNTWCKGKATTTLTQADIWFAAYTCQQIAGTWKCGCRDQACATTGTTRGGGLWQLQGIKK
jgi:hypothetical protein